MVLFKPVVQARLEQVKMVLFKPVVQARLEQVRVQIKNLAISVKGLVQSWLEQALSRKK